MSYLNQSRQPDTSISRAVEDVHSWLQPGADLAAIEAAVRMHAERMDLSAVSELSAAPETMDELGSALETDRMFVYEAGGCGSVHLPQSAINRRPRIHADLCGLAAEATAVTGGSFTATLRTPAITFPRSRLTIDFGGISERPRMTARAGETDLMCGRERVRLQPGVCAGVLRAEHSGTWPRVHTAATVRGMRLATDDGVLQLGIPDFFEIARPPSESDMTGLERTLDLIERASPRTLAEISLITRSLVPLRKPAGRAIHSSSARELPGMVYAVFAEPMEAVAMVCHEYHHLKLFLLEESLRLLGNPDQAMAAPWRPDIRKAEGVLHGTYVFFGIASLFDALFNVLKPTRRGYRRLAVWRACVEAGINQIRGENAQPTAAGEALVSGMNSINSRALEEMTESHRDDVRWARSVIQQHLATAGTDRRQEPWFLLI